ncbi:MAG: hypothetical protein E7058_01200 [Lentisphaerae bacterium]|nr:hypothetical protein [Lentisphaerota bacterium]
MRCEIVLLVENIDICRYFYREVLGLGEPVIDSNFQTVFVLNESAALVLEKCELPYMAHASASCRFALETTDLAALQERMQKNGTPLSTGFSRMDKDVYCGSDPEGNVFLIKAVTL